MSEDTVYLDFIKWLGSTWWGLPEAEELLPLIKIRYSPEEAAAFTNLPFSETSLEDLAKLKQMDTGELEALLESGARKGVIFKMRRPGGMRYRLIDSFMVFLRSVYWGGPEGEARAAMAPYIERYFVHGFFDQFGHARTRGLRTLPVERTIEDTRAILPFEDVVKVLEDQDYFCASHCSCKWTHNLTPYSHNCEHNTEVCLHFGDLARYIVQNGHGREITREECREILLECAEAGLVHGVSNWKTPVDTICNCCQDCCMFFKAYHLLGHGKSLDVSNYRVRTHPETCAGCGLCVKRCPMNALKLEKHPEAKNRFGKASVLNPDLCLGCGVCAFKCPTESLVLERRAEITEPPDNPGVFIGRFMADKANPLPRRKA